MSAIINRTYHDDNNTTQSTGVFEHTDKYGKVTYLAMTLAASKWFKTRKGAERWLTRRGYTG